MPLIAERGIRYSDEGISEKKKVRETAETINNASAAAETIEECQVRQMARNVTA